MSLYEYAIDKLEQIRMQPDIGCNLLYYPKTATFKKYMTAENKIKVVSIPVFVPLANKDKNELNKYVIGFKQWLLYFKEKYPGWILRMYTDESLYPKTSIWSKMIKDAENTIRKDSDNIIQLVTYRCNAFLQEQDRRYHKGLFGTTIRYLSWFDPDVSISAFRDIDFTPSINDYYMLEEFNDSDKVIGNYDMYFHLEGFAPPIWLDCYQKDRHKFPLFLAGLWAAKFTPNKEILKEIQILLTTKKDFMLSCKRHDKESTYGIDEIILNHIIRNEYNPDDVYKFHPEYIDDNMQITNLMNTKLCRSPCNLNFYSMQPYDFSRRRDGHQSLILCDVLASHRLNITKYRDYHSYYKNLLIYGTESALIAELKSNPALYDELTIYIPLETLYKINNITSNIKQSKFLQQIIDKKKFRDDMNLLHYAIISQDRPFINYLHSKYGTKILNFGNKIEINRLLMSVDESLELNKNLYKAVKFNNRNKAFEYINSYADPDWVSSNSDNAIILAAKEGKCDILKLFYNAQDEGYIINEFHRDEYGNSALDYAILKCSLKEGILRNIVIQPNGKGEIPLISVFNAPDRLIPDNIAYLLKYSIDNRNMSNSKLMEELITIQTLISGHKLATEINETLVEPNNTVKDFIKDNLIDFAGNFDKLMIVAHPDDEFIFGGKYLLEEKGWKVITVTNGYHPIRREEFRGLMRELGQEYKMLSHYDTIEHGYIEQYIVDYIKNIIKTNKQKLIKIVTHNSEGEYGHPQHIGVSRMVTDIVVELNLTNKLYHFSKGKVLSKKTLEQVYSLMEKYYPSQYYVIDKLNLRDYINRQYLRKFEQKK